MGQKQYSLRSVPFHYIASVRYVYLVLTFVILYSLCSFHIQIGMGLNYIHALILPYIIF